MNLLILAPCRVTWLRVTEGTLVGLTFLTRRITRARLVLASLMFLVPVIVSALCTVEIK